MPVRQGQLDGNWIARADNLSRHGEALHAGDIPDSLEPRGLKLACGPIAQLRLDDFDFDIGDGRAEDVPIHAWARIHRSAPDNHIGALDHSPRTLGKPCLNLRSRAFGSQPHHLGHIAGHLKRGAVIHLNAGGDKVAINGGEEVEFDVAMRQQTHGHDHRANHRPDGHQYPACREPQNRIQGYRDEPLKPRVNHPAHNPDRPQDQVWFVGFRDIKLREAARKDKQSLQKRKRQHDHHDERDVREELAQDAGQLQQGPECDQCRDGRKHNRNRNPLRALYGGLKGRQPLFVVGVDVLRHHNGVIDDDPDG